MENIAFDSHKRYTFCRVEDANGRLIEEKRIEHVRGEIRKYLSRFTAGSSVAVETIGNWYWIVDEIEEAGMKPQLTHARKAKMMICCANKTDSLDAKGLNLLQRNGTLPTVWIPDKELRDKRDICRTRMFFVSRRTGIKNRVHSMLAKYAVHIKGVSDIFCKKGLSLLSKELSRLPEHTRYTAKLLLEELDTLNAKIESLNEKMRELFNQTEETRLLSSIPGIGFLLSVVISLEIGDIERFSGPDRLASYSGTTPRVYSSGGKTRYGNLRSDVNHYLKWAFVEGANSICINREKWPLRYVCMRYANIRNAKGHPKAIGAVARHLAESAFWVLKRKKEYKDRALK